MRPLDCSLPAELEAREPPEARGLARDEVRLMVSCRQTDAIFHTNFRALPRFLAPGDLLVVNDSGTIPAALTAIRKNGDEFALHLSTRMASHIWAVEPRKTAVRAGERDELPDGGAVTFLAPHHGSTRLWRALVELPLPVFTYLGRWGKPIRYPYVTGEWPIEMYQTVYARNPGSAEMPSAGRPFSERVLSALAAWGVQVAAITLHAGVASLEEHEAPYEEWFEVPPATAAAVNAARRSCRRVVAVGTTVIRALESGSEPSGLVHEARGWTDLVVTPERRIRSADALLTGFHEPRATHLAMLEAIAGRRHLESAYDAALANGYLWHEFGDVHLIL
ncbi:MAG: S-adenosylmethionine:tRNA ribosyltransferase-isomerase [Chloroflexi bacterium]|nr:MAG: S-adenosylmethionine:tRNA ribosyltransferase-isomerase [Chloroflexota bacterium]